MIMIVTLEFLSKEEEEEARERNSEE